jgi:hypothetical protein
LSERASASVKSSAFALPDTRTRPCVSNAFSPTAAAPVTSFIVEAG